MIFLIFSSESCSIDFVKTPDFILQTFTLCLKQVYFYMKDLQLWRQNNIRILITTT